MRRLVARTGLVLGLACALLVVLATPASAHTISGPRPSNYRTTILSVQPPVPGVTVRIVDLGAKTELTNRTGTDVIVLGYEGEPYLRIGPNGVYENTHSAATYINRTRQGGTVPEGVNTGPQLAPEWKKIGDGTTARWHDHRAHWMGTSLPPVVQTSPGRFHRISVADIKFVHDGQTSTVAVALDWVPGPSGLPWIPVIVVFFGLAFTAAVVARWSRVLAVVIGVLVVADATHAITYELARPGSGGAKVGQFFAGSFVSIIVWIVAIPTMIGLWKRRFEALYGAIFVGLMVALVGGLTDLSSLWKSQLPGVGPNWLTRLEVALALGGGAGVAVGSFVRLVRSERSTRAARTTEPGGWVGTLVVGLSDKELRRIAADLDVDEVLDAALADLATRLTPAAAAFEPGALVLTVAADDDVTRHTRSLVARNGTVAVEPGRVEPSAAELGVAFPLLLQLLAGTVSLDDAVAQGRVATSGDADLVRVVGDRFGERTTAPVDDRAPAP